MRTNWALEPSETIPTRAVAKLLCLELGARPHLHPFWQDRSEDILFLMFTWGSVIWGQGVVLLVVG